MTAPRAVDTAETDSPLVPLTIRFPILRTVYERLTEDEREAIRVAASKAVADVVHEHLRRVEL